MDILQDRVGKLHGFMRRFIFSGLAGFTVLFFFFRVYNDDVNMSLPALITTRMAATRVGPSGDIKPSRSALDEMLAIVQTTPSLWGYHNKDMLNNSSPNRIEEQKRWIDRILRTEFVKKSRPKKLIVYVETGDKYYGEGTNYSVNCPYIPEFESKCLANFVHLNWREMFKKPPEPYIYKYDGVDAVIGIRNGFWGLDDQYEEQLLPPGVAQIFYQIESPCHTGSARLGSTGAWLTSYWSGADIPIPTYELVDTSNASIKLQDYEIYLTLPNWVSHEQQNRGRRKKIAAALISNCIHIKNDRIGYIAQLKKHMSVDLYGGCGNLTCPENCTTFLRQNYKFYLAFENCNCEDYITEKFFATSLGNGIVPVVMGASKQSYERVAPPHSFIHVDDFPLPKELAKYLQQLDENDSLYQKYFDWRRKPGAKWVVSNRNQIDIFCRVCGMLYYADFVPPPPWPSSDTRFIDVAQCAENKLITQFEA